MLALSGKTGEIRAIPLKSIAFLAAEGVLASLAGHFAYYYALQLGRASQVVPITAAFPIVTVILTAAVLGEGLTPGKVLGGLMIVAGVFMVKVF